MQQANWIAGSSAAHIYGQEIREEVRQLVFLNNPELEVKCRASNPNENERSYAEFEFTCIEHQIFIERFQALPESEKAVYQQKSLESKYQRWRELRAQGLLIENAESLAQKEEDERIRAMPSSSFLSGGDSKWSRENICAPFCSKVVKNNNVLVFANEYF